MSSKGSGIGAYDTAERRWAGVGPYYAMFPAAFADCVVKRYSDPGDTVLDPFAGRGTSLFSAAVQKRFGVGVEVNPVGWVYAQAKLHAAAQDDVQERLKAISRSAWRFRAETERLPAFYSHCFSGPVLAFLLAARAMLNWRRSKVDWTTAALLLVNLHGKRDASLSNQMRQTKSMSPQYAIEWWHARKLRPPKVDPLEFMERRLAWRYAHGRPTLCGSRVFLGDSVRRLPALAEQGEIEARLLFTSPPYCAVTNYHYDQWLRLWMLGGSPEPRTVSGSSRGRFWNSGAYEHLLRDVFAKTNELLTDDATVYVRTHKRELTYTITRRVLREVFPEKRMRTFSRPFTTPTQTSLFGDVPDDTGEVDLILKP
ncbi:MAG: DNA methyltransferase [Terrimicrobiaceae bacterium]|nr:DNA methyltransferase [Terrimicrobiaceae bacterium]